MADKEFKPCEVWIPKDSDARKYLSRVMYEHIENGGPLYMVEEKKIGNGDQVVPSARALISTSENGLDDPDPENFSEYVPLGILTQEVRVKEDSIQSCPKWMQEHVENGGQLYMRRSYIGEFALIMTERDSWYAKDACLPVENFERVTVEDFADAVAEISEPDVGLGQG